MAKKQTDMDVVKDDISFDNQDGSNSKLSRSHLMTKILIVLLVVAFAVAGWFYWKYSETQKILNSNQTEAEIEKEIEEITSAVSKLMILPEEKPQIATVVDPDSLVEEQPFYEGVEKGDKVLFYAEAKKAVVYSPKKNIIINAGPVYYTEEAMTDQTISEQETNSEE
ncbi:MAG: hypothetical protein WCX70_00350 [Candidatus Paceibacterota bacterium]|jgi:hypothetical protein